METKLIAETKDSSIWLNMSKSNEKTCWLVMSCDWTGFIEDRLLFLVL